MKKKITVLLIILFFTPSCGFSPIYSNKNNYNISIEQLSLTGDRTLNNYLKSSLNKYKNNEEATKKISLKVATDYQKTILSKDLTGTVNKYELVAEVIFIIMPNNQRLVFSQKKIMENMSNKTNEIDFENTTKQTFANIMANELINKLAEIK
jgi:outer membrane lipopolysaccharide assembly protein LptE/RlpB